MGYVALNGMTICELERMWNEWIMAYFKVLSKNFPGGTEQTMKNFRIADLQNDIQTHGILNTNQEC